MLKYAIKPMSNVASAKRNANIMDCEAELKTALCAPINITYQLVIEIMETITSERYKNLYRMKVKQAVNYMRKTLSDHERRLKASKANLFRVEDICNAQIYRKGMTDDEFFEFWQCCGAHGYVKSKYLMDCLRNIYVKVHEHRGKSYPEVRSVCFLATQAMEIIDRIYWGILEKYSDDGLVSVNMLDNIFRELRMNGVQTAIERFMAVIDKDYDFEIDGLDSENVKKFVGDLATLWMDDEFFAGTIRDALDSHDVFSSKGMIKKVKIGINEGIAEVKRRKEDADGSEKK